MLRMSKSSTNFEKNKRVNEVLNDVKNILILIIILN
jgi:hypothetical protein